MNNTVKAWKDSILHDVLMLLDELADLYYIEKKNIRIDRESTMEFDEYGIRIQKVVFSMLSSKDAKDTQAYGFHKKAVVSRVERIMEAVGMAGWEKIARDIVKAMAPVSTESDNG